MNTQDKVERIKQIISDELADDSHFSLIIFEQEVGDLWKYFHVHNFDRDSVIAALRSAADSLEEMEDEDDFNLN